MAPVTACALDMPSNASIKGPSDHRRQESASLGRQLSRKRLLSSRPKLVYRNVSGSAYRQVALLDPYDIVLASDIYEKIDVIPITGTSEDRGQGEETLGSPLAVHVQVQPRAHICSMRTIRRGEAFAVGTAEGELRIFATEHASTWCAKQPGLVKSPFGQTTISPSLPSTKGFIASLWKGFRPLRRFKFDQDSISLTEQHKRPGDERISGLTELSDWADPHNFDAVQRLAETTKWDFWETPSSLLATHMSFDDDNFCVRVLDERQPQVAGNHVFVHGHKMLALSSMSFISEKIVATTSIVFSSVCMGNSSVTELWDLRMMREPANAVTIAAFPRETCHPYNTCKSLSTNFPYRQTESFVNGTLLLWSGDGTAGFQCLNVFNDDVWNIPCATSGRQFTVGRHCGLVAHYGEQHDRVYIYDALNAESGTAGQNKRGAKRPRSGVPFINVQRLRDRYGTQTSLRSMAFNESGTCLVGGTADGDLFVCR